VQTITRRQKQFGIKRHPLHMMMDETLERWIKVLQYREFKKTTATSQAKFQHVIEE